MIVISMIMKYILHVYLVPIINLLQFIQLITFIHQVIVFILLQIKTAKKFKHLLMVIKFKNINAEFVNQDSI